MSPVASTVLRIAVFCMKRQMAPNEGLQNSEARELITLRIKDLMTSEQRSPSSSTPGPLEPRKRAPPK
jgi:hypothetical protein